MKLIEIEQLRKMDAKKLAEESLKAEQSLFKTRFEVKNGQSKSSHLIKKYNRYLARIRTLMNAQSVKAEQEEPTK
jgi:ribosomal protein L29